MDKHDRAYVILSIAALISSIALLIGVISNVSTIFVGPLLFALQFLLFVVAVAIAWFIINRMSDNAMKMMLELKTKYDREFEKLRRKRPSFVASLLIIGQAIILIADKSFNGNPVRTIIVSIALLLVFWIANELQERESRKEKIFGAILWFIGVFILPASVYIYSNGDISYVVNSYNSLDMSTKNMLMLVFGILLVLPFVFIRSIRRA